MAREAKMGKRGHIRGLKYGKIKPKYNVTFLIPMG
jgi:hypothetical protein